MMSGMGKRERGARCLQELDVDAEMARGLLPGALALSAKFGPVVRRVAQRCLEALRQLAADPAAFSERVQDPSHLLLCVQHTDGAGAGMPVPGLDFLCVDRCGCVQVSTRVSEKVAAVRERVGVPDSHSATDGHSPVAGAVYSCCCMLSYKSEPHSILSAGSRAWGSCQDNAPQTMLCQSCSGRAGLARCCRIVQAGG